MYWLLLLLVLFVAYRMLARYQPKFFHSENARIADLIANFKAGNFEYRPVPWIIHKHIHTGYGMKYRKNPKCSPVRELFVFSDGGQCALDHISAAEQTAKPLVVVVPTYTSGSREPCTLNMAVALDKAGFNAIVASNRGCGGVEITSKKLFNAYEYSDLQEIVKHLRETQKPSAVFICAFSYGGNEALKYLAEDGGVDGAMLVSINYDLVECEKIFQRFPYKALYNKLIIARLKKIVSKSKYLDHKKLDAIDSIEAFDRNYTVPFLDGVSAEEYFRELSSYDKLERVKTPTLLIGADDDPFTRKDLQPREAARKSDNLLYMTYPEGGHVSFLTDRTESGSILDSIAIQWFNSILNTRN